jgi:hypothetical protein
MSTPSLGDAEPTLVEKLRQIADAKQGEPAPACLCGGEPWAVILAQIAKDAADALERQGGAGGGSCSSPGWLHGAPAHLHL